MVLYIQDKKGEKKMDTMAMLEVITGLTLLAIGYITDYLYGDKN